MWLDYGKSKRNWNSNHKSKYTGLRFSRKPKFHFAPSYLWKSEAGKHHLVQLVLQPSSSLSVPRWKRFKVPEFPDVRVTGQSGGNEKPRAAAGGVWKVCSDASRLWTRSSRRERNSPVRPHGSSSQRLLRGPFVVCFPPGTNTNSQTTWGLFVVL